MKDITGTNSNKIRKNMKIYDMLEPDEEKILENIQKNNRVFFDVAIKFLKLGYELFPSDDKLLKNNLNPNIQTSFWGLYAQIFMLYRSIMVLCKCGLDLESIILLRSMFETLIYFYYIAEKNHEERLNIYLHSRALSEYVSVCEYAGMNQGFKSQYKLEFKSVEEKYNAALKYFRNKHGQNLSPKEIKYKYALKAKKARESLEKSSEEKIFFDKHYKTMYRYASAICHAERIPQHVRLALDTERILIRKRSTDGHIGFSLSYATVYIFCAMSKLNEILKIGKDKEIDEMQKEIDKFAEK